MEDFADDVHRVVLKVAGGVNPSEISAKYILVGWSIGGMVVMTMATKYSNYYSRLVLVGSGPIDGLKFASKDKHITKEEVQKHNYFREA